jgi:hypothetical protein
MTCQLHSPVVSLVLIHRKAESLLGENGDLGDHFLGMLRGLFSLIQRNNSFGPLRSNYQAFACYDLLDGGKQKLSEYGVWTGDT